MRFCNEKRTRKSIKGVRPFGGKTFRGGDACRLGLREGKDPQNREGRGAQVTSGAEQKKR